MCLDRLAMAVENRHSDFACRQPLVEALYETLSFLAGPHFVSLYFTGSFVFGDP